MHRLCTGFCIVTEAEVDVFLEFLCFLYDPIDVGNLISGSSAFFKPSLFTGRTDVEAETPTLWPPDAKS